MSVYKNEIAYEITAVDDKTKTVDVKFIDGTERWARIELASLGVVTLEQLDEAVKQFAPPVEAMEAAAQLDTAPFRAAIGKGRLTPRPSRPPSAATPDELKGAEVPLAEEAVFIRDIVREEIARDKAKRAEIIGYVEEAEPMPEPAAPVEPTEPAPEPAPTP